jgi:hypothetical protein
LGDDKAVITGKGVATSRWIDDLGARDRYVLDVWAGG